MFLTLNFNNSNQNFVQLLAENFAKNILYLTEKNQLTNNFLNVFLNGNLGAGKTFFMQNFIHSLGFKGNVKSPTYSVLETYSINNLNININHFDFYRIQNPQDFYDYGFEDYFNQQNNLCFSEWSENVKTILPTADIIFNFEYINENENENENENKNLRNININAISEKGKLCLENLQNLKK